MEAVPLIRGVAVVTIGVLVAGVARSWAREAGFATRSAAASGERWQAVTINRTVDEVLPEGRRPAPLVELGADLEVQARPATGKGTELRARWRGAETRTSSTVARLAGQDADSSLRIALRHAKQLLEVGEVLKVEPVSHGRRRHTPTGWLIDLADRRADRGGIL